MTKKSKTIVFEGKVTEALPDSRFRVELENNHQVIAMLSGKMRKKHISVIIGDKVEVELSMYDLKAGRIIRRLKFER